MPGQRGETTKVKHLLSGIACQSLLADKAYDADWLRSFLIEHNIEAVIPPRKGRKHPACYDEEKYKWRHLIENWFQKIKEFKRIAIRADKTDTSYAAMITISASLLTFILWIPFSILF